MKWWTQKSLEKKINKCLKDDKSIHMINICVDPISQQDYYLSINSSFITDKLNFNKYIIELNGYRKNGSFNNKILLSTNKKSEVIEFILNKIPKLPIKTERWIMLKCDIEAVETKKQALLDDLEYINNKLKYFYKELGKEEQIISKELQSKTYINVETNYKEKEDEIDKFKNYWY